MVTGKGAMRGFPFICKQLLLTMNNLFCKKEMKYSVYGLQVDFSKEEIWECLSGLFTNKLVLGLLEAKY